jgi:hypothetical protein
LLRPGGNLVVGSTYGPDDDPVAAAVDDLFTVRAGGSVVPAPAMIERHRAAGFSDVREIERTWDAPLRLVAAGRG